MLHIPRVIWGVYTITSALLLLINGVTGFRQARRWAWYVACYQIVFFAIVAAIKPDLVGSTIFAIIVIACMVRSYRRFFPKRVRPEPPLGPAR